MMPISTGEPFTLNEADTVTLRTENREWSNEIRRRMAELVNSRMARKISHEEYLLSRQAAKEERAECDRREASLSR